MIPEMNVCVDRAYKTHILKSPHSRKPNAWARTAVVVGIVETEPKVRVLDL